MNYFNKCSLYDMVSNRDATKMLQLALDDKPVDLRLMTYASGGPINSQKVRLARTHREA